MERARFDYCSCRKQSRHVLPEKQLPCRKLLAESAPGPVGEGTEEFQPPGPREGEAEGEEGLLNISDTLQISFVVWTVAARQSKQRPQAFKFCNCLP